MDAQFTTDKNQLTYFAALCAAYGLQKVVISPGSRSAPLTVAFHNQPGIECYIVPDERSASYFAIGIAQYTQKPVGIICTSGTAALNYVPAIAEAYHQKLPIVAITADRPPEWVGQLDGQTVDQTGIYRNFVGFETQLPLETSNKSDLWHLERMVRDGFLQLRMKSLPVHFNVPLREPLYKMIEYTTVKVSSAITDEVPVKMFPGKSKLEQELESYSRILVIVGMRRPDPLFSSLIQEIAGHEKVVVLSENLSNIYSNPIFLTSDALLSSIQEKEVKALEPDLVISFGDMLLSKPLKNWVRSIETDHWIVHEESSTPDVFQKVERIIPFSPLEFLSEFKSHLNHLDSDFYFKWKKVQDKLSSLQPQFVKDIPWSDMKVFSVLSERVPENSIVHLGNSSPVRYAQFFKWNRGILFFGNRGTAGIDGTTSTAIGMASQTNQTVTLITGDISFLYDTNALWNYYKKGNFKIIVINNKGGNIFRLIPGPDNTGLLDPYFMTHIPVSLEHLSVAYGIHYYAASGEKELLSSLEKLYADANCSLLEIHTSPDTNTAVWKDYFKNIKSNMTYEQ